MQARFNYNNKLLGKNMIEHGEVNNLLVDEQCGSRKEKSEISNQTCHQQKAKDRHYTPDENKCDYNNNA